MLTGAIDWADVGHSGLPLFSCCYFDGGSPSGAGREFDPICDRGDRCPQVVGHFNAQSSKCWIRLRQDELQQVKHIVVIEVTRHREESLVYCVGIGETRFSRPR